MGMFNQDSHDRKKLAAVRGTSTGVETDRSSHRLIYSQTNGWQQSRAARIGGGRTHRFSALHSRWSGRSL